MVTKKKAKSKDWLDNQVDELNDAFQDKVIPEKKSKWPKVIVGSHSTRTEYEDGRVEFVTDWDALQRDVRQAILKYESTMPVETTVAATAKKKKAKK